MVSLLGLSNHWAWQVERARVLAAAGGSARADVLQYHQRRTSRIGMPVALSLVISSIQPRSRSE